MNSTISIAEAIGILLYVAFFIAMLLMAVYAVHGWRMRYSSRTDGNNKVVDREGRAKVAAKFWARSRRLRG